MLAQQNNLTNKVTPLFVDRSLPPQNIEAEESILGGILLSGAAALARVKHILEQDAFYVAAHREIYKEMLRLDRKNLPIELLTVASALKERGKIFETIGGTAKLVHLIDRTVSDVNIDRYAELVQEKFLRRQAIAISNEISDFAYSSSTSLPDIAEYIRDRYTEITGSALVTGTAKSIKFHQCDRLLAKINHIQFHIDSPTQKEFLMQDLARESGRSKNELQTLFYKSLIEDEWEPTLSLAQLRDKYGDTVREWLLHGFIPKGATTLIHALGGHGKTRLIYDFIYHLALGEAWQGFPVTKKSKILIIQTDEQPVDMLNALEIRGIRADDPRFDIHYKTRWSTEHIPQLYQEVERERFDMILIDSLASVSRYSTVSENDAEFAKPILLLNKIAADFNTAIMLIHHSSKAGDARGTTAVYNAVSQVFQLTKDANDHNPASCDRVLMIQKSRARRPAKYALAFNPEDGSWRFDGEDTHVTDINSPVKDQIVEFLSQHRGVRFRNEDLAQAINFSVNTVRKVLNELGGDGIISWKKQGRGKIYWIESFEANVTNSQCDPTKNGGGSVTDQFADQFANPDTVGDTAPTDPLIRKNEKFSTKKKGGVICTERISSPETQSPQELQTDPSLRSVGSVQPEKTSETQTESASQEFSTGGSVHGSVDQLADQIKKGDRLILRDGCGFSPKVDIDWEDGTVLEVIAVGLKGMYLNQLQVKKLGDSRCAAWIPIANIELMQVSKDMGV